MRTYLVVETAFLVEEVEELGVSLATPEVHVTDLEVTPDWMKVTQYEEKSEEQKVYSDICCTFLLRLPTKRPLRYLMAKVLGSLG